MRLKPPPPPEGYADIHPDTSATGSVEEPPERDLPSLLRRARAHVKATVDRAPNRTAYEAACVLLVEIDEALK